MHTPDDPDGETFIYVKSFFHKGLGRRVYASQYGKRAFRLKIRNRTPKRSGPPTRRRGSRTRAR